MATIDDPFAASAAAPAADPFAPASADPFAPSAAAPKAAPPEVPDYSDPVNQAIFQQSSAGTVLDAVQGKPDGYFKNLGSAITGPWTAENNPPGLSDETKKVLEDAGIFPDYAKGRANSFQVMNAAVGNMAAVAFDDVHRALGSIAGGIGAAVAGLDPGETNDRIDEAQATAFSIPEVGPIFSEAIGFLKTASSVTETGGIVERAAPTLRDVLEKPETTEARATAESAAPTVEYKAPVENPAIDQKSGNLNLKYINTDQTGAENLAKAAQAIADRDGVVVSFGSMKQSAQTFMDTAVKDEALGLPQALVDYNQHDPANAAMSIASRESNVALEQEARELAQKAAQTGDHADFVAASAARQKWLLMNGTRHEISATGGRLGVSHQVEVGAGEEAEAVAQGMAEKTQHLSDEEYVQMMNSFKSNDEAARFARDVEKPGWGKMAGYTVVNNWISGIITHSAYAVANKAMAIVRMGIDTPIASAFGALDRVRGLVLEPEEASALQAEREGIENQFAASDNGSLKIKAVDAVRMKYRLDEIKTQLKNGISITSKEMQARVFGTIEGRSDAFRAFGRAFWHGESPMLPGEIEKAKAAAMKASQRVMDDGGTAVEAQKAGQEEYQKFAVFNRNPILDRAKMMEDGLPKTLFTVWGKGVGALGRYAKAVHTDTAFFGYFEERNASMWRQAIAEGLQPGSEDFAVRIAHLKNNASPEMLQQWVTAGKRASLINKPGEFGQAMEHLAHVNSLTGFFIPFVRIATNITAQAFLERTPIGWMSPVIRDSLMGKNGLAEKEMAWARMSTGTMGLAWGAWLKHQDKVTGAAPETPNERAMAYRNGDAPYSARIGDWNMPLRWMGVIGKTLSYGADVADIAGHAALDPRVESVMGYAIHRIGQNTLQEGPMKSMSEPMDAIESPYTTTAEKYVINTIVSATLPASSALGQITHYGSDPYVRSTMGDSFWDRLGKSYESRIPGASDNLHPRVDIFGDPLLRDQNHEEALKDPVFQTFMDLGYSPGKVLQKFGGVQLTDDQYYDYSVKAGKLLHYNVEQQINRPDWTTIGKEAQVTLLHQAMKDSRAGARQYMCTAYPDISQKCSVYLKKLASPQEDDQ